MTGEHHKAQKLEALQIIFESNKYNEIYTGKDGRDARPTIKMAKAKALQGSCNKITAV